jgi:hypothetical protein
VSGLVFRFGLGIAKHTMVLGITLVSLMKVSRDEMMALGMFLNSEQPNIPK